MVLGLFRRDKIFKPSDRMNEYTIENIIGEGRYGICYKVSTGERLYILKQLKRGMMKRAGAKACFEEEVLMNLQHKNIPRFIEKIEQKDFHGYILEFKEGKTFEDVIYLEKHVFGREEIYRVGSRLVEVLKYLHSKGIVHRDIRVSNALYDGGTVYLVDFGLARRIDDKKYRADIDFAFLGDFLVHLYYTSIDFKAGKRIPWYRELELTEKELIFLKRLMGVEQRYKSILEVEKNFNETFEDCI